MEDLNEIKYRFVIDLTKYFLNKYREKEIENLELVIRNVKQLSSFVQNISFTFDETIWHPTNPEWYGNLIEFRVQLIDNMSNLPFRLFVDKGINQEPIYQNKFNFS